MVVQEHGEEAVRPDLGPTADFADLLELARSGDPGALGELWSRYAPAVAGFVRARGSLEVDEITNDVFLAAFTGLVGPGAFVGGAGDFKALLFTIARRRVVDELRRRARRVVSRPWRPSDETAGRGGPEDEAVLGESTRALLEQVERLTPDQRDVVLLRLVADLSIEEVALTLGRTPGSVKSLQRRGLDALRRQWPAPTPPDRSRPDHSRPDQSRPDQSRPDHHPDARGTSR